MGYTIDRLAGKELGGFSSDGHVASTYRILVTGQESSRWASVECRCGETSVAKWTTDSGDYRELVLKAWMSGCGAAALTAA